MGRPPTLKPDQPEPDSLLCHMGAGQPGALYSTLLSLTLLDQWLEQWSYKSGPAGNQRSLWLSLYSIIVKA